MSTINTTRRTPEQRQKTASKKGLVAQPGEVALVTGASSGIGQAYARALAQLGFEVILVARRVERLEELAVEIKGTWGVDARVLAADLNNSDEVAEVEKRLRQRAEITVLVNNAGFSTYGSFAELPIDAQLSMVHVHVVAATRLAHAVLPQMRHRNRGFVVNIGSTLALIPAPGASVYVATKAYLNALSRTLQHELRGTGVRIQALNPGYTITGFHHTAAWRDVDMGDVPFALTPEQVVAESIRALPRSRVLVVPGLMNRWMVRLPWLSAMLLRRHWAQTTNRTKDGTAARIESDPTGSNQKKDPRAVDSITRSS